ncbi:MAG: hypothetical protein ACFFKA_01475 [Candidatus Thorarchaeota archaeon]
MKIIFEEFYCPECKQNRWLKVENICIDCEDKKKLEKISQF